MSDAPLNILFEMIVLVMSNVIGTMLKLLGMFGQLVGSLLQVIGVGGGLGLVIGLVILGLVVYFLAKFFFGSMKTVIILAAAGVIVLFLIVWGLSV